MTNTVMKALLSKVGIPENTWVTLDKVHKIILSGDGNEFPTLIQQLGNNKCEVNHYYFDTTNEFLKIKKYTEPRLISNRFRDDCKATSSYIDCPAFIGLFNRLVYPGKGLKGMKIRPPKIGDYVFTVDPTTLKQVNYTMIESEEYRMDDGVCRFYFSDPIQVEGMILGWALGNDFLTSTPNENDESILSISRPITSREFDTIIAFAFIGGIELFRKRV